MSSSLGKLTGSLHCVPVDHKRRKYLNETVLSDVKVEHEIDYGPLQSRSRPFIYAESGPGNLRSPLKIQYAQICAYVPMSLFFEIKNSRFSPFSDFYVCAVVRAYRSFGSRGVWNC